MEELSIIGNLGKEPEVRATSGGKLVVTLQVAVNGKDAGGTPVTHWYTVDCWEQLGDVAKKWLHTGSKIWVRGMPRAEAWTSRSGTLRSIIKIKAQRLEMLGGKKENDGGANAFQGCTEQGYTEQGYTEVSEEQLPF